MDDRIYSLSNQSTGPSLEKIIEVQIGKQSYPSEAVPGRGSGCGRPGFDPRPRHTKDVKTGRFALLSLALGIIELGYRLGGSESVQMV